MELYIIPFKREFIIYRPLLKLAFIANKKMALYLKERIAGNITHYYSNIENFLDSIDFWRDDPPVPDSSIHEYKPVKTALLMTGNCNMKCTYCYARGGEDKTLNMPFSIARTVIDYIYKNASESGRNNFSISFHGGGEPALNWETLKKSVEYAKNKDLPCKISMSTNGVLEDYQKEFIIKHFDSLNISFDGIAEIQEKQRPLCSGKSSFYSVIKTIKEFDTFKLPYSIRITSVPNSFNRLSDSISFICEETNCQTVQIEPCYLNRRGIYLDPLKSHIKSFTSSFIKAYETGRDYGRHVFYSGARPWTIASSFCLCPEDCLVVTPEGDIVTCFEIHDRRHPLFPQFTAGRVDSSVDVDRDKIYAFIDKQKSRRNNCRPCFCYYHCGGDCPSRVMATEKNKRGRCDVNRILTAELLAWYITEGNGLWNGFSQI
jgi:uncharacterized protein